MKQNLKKIAIITGIITAIILGIAISMNIAPKSNDNGITEPEIEANVVIPNANDFLFQERLEINPEYIGELKVGNDLLSESVTQANDNQKYLDLAWNLETDSSGAAFMDYRNSLDDQNLIIYGHYVYADEEKMFGPLHQLKDEENYEENKVITLELENEIREYVVTNVFYYEMGSLDLEYYYPKYNGTIPDDQKIRDEKLETDENYFNNYMKTIEIKEFYHIDEDLTIDDRWLTLQTCVRNRDDLRLIVLAKEVNRTEK